MSHIRLCEFQEWSILIVSHPVSCRLPVWDLIMPRIFYHCMQIHEPVPEYFSNFGACKLSKVILRKMSSHTCWSLAWMLSSKYMKSCFNAILRKHIAAHMQESIWVNIMTMSWILCICNTKPKYTSLTWSYVMTSYFRSFVFHHICIIKKAT